MIKRPMCLLALAFALIVLPGAYGGERKEPPCPDGARVTVQGDVCGREEKNDKYLIYLRHISILEENRKIPLKKLIIYLEENPQLKIGSTVRVSGTIKWPEPAGNPGQFDAAAYYKIMRTDGFVYGDETTLVDGGYNWYLEAITQIRERMGRSLDRVLPENDSQVLKAMLLGEKGQLDSQIKERFQSGGISHILAISGLHISIIGMTIFNILRKIRCPVWAAGVLSTVLMGSYVLMTGQSVSAVRALLMFSLMTAGKILGRTYDLGTGTAFAAILILADNPYYLFYSGLLLSFGAVLGIAVFMPVLKELLPWKNPVSEGLKASLSVQIMSLPVLLSSFYEFPLYSVLLNLCVIPLMSLVVFTGLLGGFAGMINGTAGSFLAAPAHYILEFYQLLCSGSEKLPFHNLIIGKPSFCRIFLYYGISLLILVLWKKISHKVLRKTLPVILFCIMLFILTGRNDPEFELVSLDVSQGDGIFIQSQGFHMLVDAGSSDVKEVGKYRILPFLKSRGIRKLDYVLMTHADADHTSGIRELIQFGYPIRCLLLPDIANRDEAYMEMRTLAEDAGIEVGVIGEGMKLEQGGLRIQCLHPVRGYDSVDRNDGSVVLSVQYDQFRILLTGDLGEEGEERILDELLPVDILKVGHHGSGTSTSKPFLEKTMPKAALISCGAGNSYGHPHQETLERLEEIKCRTFLTMQSGAITVGIQDGRLKLETFLQNP